MPTTTGSAICAGANSGERAQGAGGPRALEPMSDVQAEYYRTTGTMENIHAMCEDYRAAASIDLKHDEADLNKKIACPLLTSVGRAGTDGAPLRRDGDVARARDEGHR